MKKRTLKKIVNNLCQDYITLTAVSHLYDSERAAYYSDIITRLFQIEREFIARINYAEKGDAQRVRVYFKKLYEDFNQQLLEVGKSLKQK